MSMYKVYCSPVVLFLFIYVWDRGFVSSPQFFHSREFFLEVCGIRFDLIRASMCSGYSSLIVFSLSCPWSLEVSLPSLFMTPCGIEVKQDRRWVLDLSTYWIRWPGFE